MARTVTALSLVALAACSDGEVANSTSGSAGSTTPSPSGTTAGISFEGVAAIGAPLVGSSVEFICTAGSPAIVSTGADGAWSTSATGVTTPCVLVVSGGRVGSASGAANTDTLMSAVAATGTANITSLTTLQLAMLTGQEPLQWLGSLRESTSGLGSVTSAGLSTALASLKTLLAGLPTPVSLPDGFDPARTKFAAVSGNEFDLLLDKLKANISNASATLKDLSVQAAANQSLVERTPVTLAMEKIGRYQHSGGAGSAEIVAFDPLSKRLFTINGALSTVDVLNLADPTAPSLVTTLTTAQFGANLGGANSVAVHAGVVALAIEANPKTDNGIIALLRAKDLRVLGTATVGALPDMLTFTPDGKYLLVANEGEPASYGQVGSIDPEGSVSIIELSTLSPGMSSLKMTVTQVGFTQFNSQSATLIASGVRIFGPGATVAQDLEPEYIAVSADSRKAYVTLQENNAIAVIDITTKTVESIKALGLKDHSVAGNGLDASNEDGGTNTNSGTASIKIQTYPVKGMYLPDGIAAFTIGSTTYLATANEGDAREYTGINAGSVSGREDPRVREYCTQGVDPTVFSGGTNTLVLDSNLGRLRITAFPPGGGNGKNAQGQCNQLVAFGGRSFSIWSADITQIWDSGDQFEQRTAALSPTLTFNASNDNDNADDRSPAKGPEPEGVAVGRIGTRTFAFIGLERVGGVMVYDVSTPSSPVYVTYLNTRGTGLTGDRGPEGLHFVRAAHSPTGKPLLIVGNETSGTTAIYQLRPGY